MNEKIYAEIKQLADKYADILKDRVDERITQMKNDDNDHYLIYRVLGVTAEEGEKIDIYQNKGRFLYRYAGLFLEEAAIKCFQHKFPSARKHRLENTKGSRPKTFEIDCLVGKRAYEIKWRDATTDGDHITKEHTRAEVIKESGYKPIRIMFYYPNRKRSIKVQETLKTLYIGLGGEYYYSDTAWDYIKTTTGIDLLKILRKIADER